MKRVLAIAFLILAFAVPAANAQWWGMQKSGFGSGSACETGSGVSKFILCFENRTIGGNELGSGGPNFLLSGVSNILVQSGDVAGYVSPGRLLDGLNDYFVPNGGLWEAVIGNTATWTIQIEMSDVNETAVGDLFAYLRDGGDNYFKAYTDTGKLYGYIKSGASVFVNDEAVADAYPVTGTVWFTFCSSAAAGKFLMGFTAAQPTKLSDFVATERILREPALTWPGLLNFGSRWGLFADSSGGVNTIGGIAVKLILSSDCLIDFAS